MTQNPRYTICTVCYNAASTIDATLDSVVALYNHEPDKDNPRFEFLVIDGKSSDDTLSRVEEKTKDLQSSMVRIFSEKDEGIYDAMNKGFEKAFGRYLVFINADDTIEPHALDIVDAAIERGGGEERVDAVGAALYVATQDGVQYIKKTRPELLEKSLPLGMLAGHQGMFFSVELAKKMGGFREAFRIAGDYDFTLRSLKAGARWVLTDEPVATFYLGGFSYALLATARDYRDVRIANGMPSYKAYAYYLKNVLASVLARSLK